MIKWIMYKVWQRDSQILDQNEAEKELASCLVRNYDVFQLIVAREEKLVKKFFLLDTDSSENISNNTEQIKCKLRRVVIKEFDGNVLNWQTFWDQFESNIDKFSYLQSFFVFIYIWNYFPFGIK